MPVDDALELPEEDITESSVRLRLDITFSQETYEYLMTEAKERKVRIEEVIADACDTAKMLDDYDKDKTVRVMSVSEYLLTE